MPTATIAYAMSDFGPSPDGMVSHGTVSVPASAGGCGQQHTAVLDAQRRPVITCGQCAPVLISSSYGFAATPSGVPLTPDEQGEVEIAEREGAVAHRLAMKAMGDAVAGMVQGGQMGAKALHAPPPPSLAEQLTALSPGDRAALIRALSAGLPDEEPVRKTTGDGVDDGEPQRDTGRGDDDPGPASRARRGPGRPRKLP